MKYFKPEYWEMINSSSKELRRKGSELWDLADKAYNEYMLNGIQDKLPKAFSYKYYENHGFHDYQIVSISLSEFESGEMSLSIVVENSGKSFCIQYLQVTQFESKMEKTQNWRKGLLSWGYDEFELNENRTWTHRILFDYESEMKVTCKRIDINEI